MSLSEHLVLRAARKLTHKKLHPDLLLNEDDDADARAGPGNPESDPPTGRWELKELEERIWEEFGVEIDLRPERDPLRSLLMGGQILRFEAGRYTEYTTPVEGMTRLTLLDLVREAKRQKDPDHVARPGSDRADKRRCEALTESQFSHIRTACNCLGRHMSGEPRDRGQEFHPALAEIGSEYFVWNPEAGRRSKGDWKKLLDLVREASPPSSTSQYVGSVRKLMNLAATHGWIARTPLHDPHYAPVPADWSHVYNEWREELRGQIDQLRTGLMELFEACYRHDQASPQSADWAMIINRLEERFDANDVSSHERTIVRRTYRAARSVGLLSGPEWDGRAYQRRDAVTLVPTGAKREVAAMYGQDGSQRAIHAALEGRKLAWPEPWPAHEGLVEGRYGLRRLLHYATVPSSKVDKLGVPDRGLYWEKRVRGKSPRSAEGWATATVEVRLDHICHFAGWVTREHGIDWSSTDLRTLFREDFLRGYKEFLQAECGGGARSWIKRFGTLARLASPYLEWIACEEGKEELGKRFVHLSKLISSPDERVDGGKSWIARWRTEDNKNRIERLRRIAKRVERTWTRKAEAAQWAYIQLRRVLEGQLELLEKDYGPLRAQVQALRTGEKRVTVDGTVYDELDRTWAGRVRDIVYWADQLIVPLRVATSVKLDRADRLEEPGFNHLHAKIHKDKRKASSPKWFRPNYCRGGGGYPVDLFRLYVMPGGARERLLTLPNGRILHAAAHYVHDIRGNAKSARMSSKSFRTLTRRVVESLLERRPRILSPGLEVPITFDELNEPDHVLATHMFRHAYARYWVKAEEDLHTASTYLDHSDHTMILEVYLGEDESDLDPAGKMAHLSGGCRPAGSAR